MPRRLSGIEGYKYTTCRHYLHAWDHDKWLLFTGVKKKGQRPTKELHEELVCLRCGTVRVDRYSPRSFERIGRSYYYPDDYIMSDGSRYKKHDYSEVHLSSGIRKAVKIEWGDE